MLEYCLTQAELVDYLDFCPDPCSKDTTLGLTSEELDRQNVYKEVRDFMLSFPGHKLVVVYMLNIRGFWPDIFLKL